MVSKERPKNLNPEEKPPEKSFLRLLLEPAFEYLAESVIRAQGHEPGFLDYLAKHENEIRNSLKRASELSKTVHPTTTKGNWQAIFGSFESLSIDYKRLQTKYDNEAKERRLRALSDFSERKLGLKSELKKRAQLDELIKAKESVM